MGKPGSRNWESHRQDQLVENIAFYREAGVSDELIAAYLGITLDWLQVVQHRREKRVQRDTHPAA